MKATTKLSLGFSSCPNDAFIFDAIVNQRIDLKGLEFDFHIADVEALNRAAIKGELDITKISFAAYLNLAQTYVLLDAGAALGEKCGPLLVSKYPHTLENIRDCSIAIPGINTTANLLLSLLFPDATNKVEIIFSGIEDAVLNEKAEIGLVIHESRFTYQSKGLLKLADIGDLWEAQTKTLVPLGGIIMKRSLSDDLQRKANEILKASVRYAFDHPKAGWDFIKSLAQSTSDEVIRQHIDLYVNSHSLDLGKDGRAAIIRLLMESKKAGLSTGFEGNLFIS